MKARVNFSKDIEGNMVVELIVDAENNKETEQLRLWFEQNDNNQGIYKTQLISNYPHFPEEESAVNEVVSEILNVEKLND